mmetsp:Transcript_6778/g.8574  ORF Transcript_6778/g.8574 Transcript_6778/m.8574 type:complete len:595 (-) Transcript_6778:1119-2903(-)
MGCKHSVLLASDKNQGLRSPTKENNGIKKLSSFKKLSFSLRSHKPSINPTKGVSVYHLQTTFLQNITQEPFNLNSSSTIYDIENLNHKNTLGYIRTKSQFITDPNDGKIGSSYVDSLDENDVDHVGIANLMLSYTWGYKIGDIVDTLVDYCNSKHYDTKRTYVWLCCLCVNQHRVVETSESESGVKNNNTRMNHSFRKGQKSDKNLVDDRNDETIQENFLNRIEGVNEVVSMVYPWNKPMSLSRIWCLFELFTAYNEKCEISIVMPPSERIKMIKELSSNESCFDDLLETLNGSNIQNAEASYEMDKIRILNIIKNKAGFTTFEALDDIVNELFTNWAKDGIMTGVETLEKVSENPTIDSDFGLLCAQLGVMLDRQDEYDLSLQLHKKAVDIFINVYGDVDHNVASAHHNVGRALFKTGDLDGALAHYRRVLAIDEELVGDDHEDTATSLSNVADVLKAQDNLEEAEKEMKRALNIRLKVKGDHPDTARSYSQIGLLYHHMEMYDEAVAEHQKALNICLKSLGENYPETATSYHNLAGALVQKKDYESALVNFEKALVIYENLFGEEHVKTKHTISWIDMVKEAIQDEEAAKES